MVNWSTKEIHLAQLQVSSCIVTLQHSPPPPFSPRRAASLSCQPTTPASNYHIATPPYSHNRLNTCATLDSITTDKAPFQLTGNHPPIPPKLVKKIQNMEFIEMWELLPDNLAHTERLEALPGPASQVGRNSEQREIGSLLTWVSCFATYVAIVAEVHPGRVKNMLAHTW